MKYAPSYASKDAVPSLGTHTVWDSSGSVQEQYTKSNQQHNDFLLLINISMKYTHNLLNHIHIVAHSSTSHI